MTAEALIEDWLRFLAHNRGRAPGTIVQYRHHLTRLAAFLDGDLGGATREHLEVFSGFHLAKAGRSAISRRPVVAAVRGFYAWAYARGYVPTNPAQFLEPPQAGRKLPVPLSLASAEKLVMAPDLATIKGLRDAAILATFIGCGVRIGGLVRMNEGDLRAMDVDGRRRTFVRVVEKGGHERLVPVPIQADLLIRTYLAAPELVEVDRTLKDGDRVLFVALRNQSIPPHEFIGERRRLGIRSVRKMMRAYGERVGVPPGELRPHAARHLFGTEMIEGGVDVAVLQRLMGHARADTTMTYIHLAVRKLAREAERGNPLAKIRTPASVVLERTG